MLNTNTPAIDAAAAATTHVTRVIVKAATTARAAAVEAGKRVAATIRWCRDS